MKAANFGNIHLLKAIINSKRTDELVDEGPNGVFPMKDEAFGMAAAAGKIKCMKAIMNSIHITSNGLGKSFVAAAAYGKVESLKTIIDCGRFHEVDPYFLGEAFDKAIIHCHFKALYAILNSGRFDDLRGQSFLICFLSLIFLPFILLREILKLLHIL